VPRGGRNRNSQGLSFQAQLIDSMSQARWGDRLLMGQWRAMSQHAEISVHWADAPRSQIPRSSSFSLCLITDRD
jgi:hypothetical protein